MAWSVTKQVIGLVIGMILQLNLFLRNVFLCLMGRYIHEYNSAFKRPTELIYYFTYKPVR